MDPLASTSSTLELDLQCWNILRAYATTDMKIGEVELQFSTVFKNFGCSYDDAQWGPKIGRIMGTESEDLDAIGTNLNWIDDAISDLSMSLFTSAGSASSTESPLDPAPSPPIRDLSIINIDTPVVPVSLPSSSTVSTNSPLDPAPSQPICNPSAIVVPVSIPSGSSVSSEAPNKARISLKSYVARKKLERPAEPGIVPALPSSTPSVQNPAASPGVNTGSSTPRLRFFDGRVGALFPNVGLYVTTPNMDVIHAPIALCETRMRRQNHFAKDDPLYWPQPFHGIVAHLAVVPCPSDSPEHPLRWAWYHPKSADFETVDFPGLTGMVRLVPSLLSEISSMCGKFRETIAKLPQEILCDRLMTRGRDQLQKYVERLSEPGARNIVSLQLTCLQRIFLETYSRSQWLEKWFPRLSDVDKTFELDPHVMGAFTGDLSVAADLFRIGIPVWLIRRLEQQVMTKILRFVAPLDEQTWNCTLPLRDSKESLDIAQADPPHPLIYRGLPGTNTRYSRMRLYVEQQFDSSLVGTFESFEAITPGTFRMASSPNRVSSEPASSLSSTREMHLLDVTTREWISPVQELKKQKTGLSRGSVHQERNRFTAVVHECFPARLHLWDEASHRLTELHRFTGPSLLDHHLPDPSIFVDPSGALKPGLVLAWLRIRPILLWRLGLPNPQSFVNKKWRAMLEAADGFRSTSKSKIRTEMLGALRSLISESHSIGITLDEDTISSASAYWNGQLIQRNTYGSLDPQIVREIIWEIYEAKFRLEMLDFDRYMVPEPKGDGEEAEMLREGWFARQVDVHRCWPGLAPRPRIAQPGFSSHSNQPLRVRYLKALFNLVRGWPGKKPIELTRPFPMENDDLQVREVEEILANYYMPNTLENWAELPFQPEGANYTNQDSCQTDGSAKRNGDDLILMLELYCRQPGIKTLVLDNMLPVGGLKTCKVHEANLLSQALLKETELRGEGN